VNGVCSPCTTDADCNVAPYASEGRTCERGICSIPSIDAGPGDDGGTRCHSRYECPAGDVCANGVCTTPPGSCQSNADCPIGQICGTSGSCLPGCADVRDCGPGQTCNMTTNTCQTTGGCNLQMCSQQCAAQNMQCDLSTCTCTATTCDVNNC